MGHGSCCECGACKFFRVIVSVLLLVAVVASAIAMWNTHVLATGFVFGTTEGTLAIIAFAFTLTKFYKVAKRLCTCGCGDSCNCGTGK